MVEDSICFSPSRRKSHFSAFYASALPLLNLQHINHSWQPCRRHLRSTQQIRSNQYLATLVVLQEASPYITIEIHLSTQANTPNDHFRHSTQGVCESIAGLFTLEPEAWSPIIKATRIRRSPLQPHVASTISINHRNHVKQGGQGRKWATHRASLWCTRMKSISTIFDC